MATFTWTNAAGGDWNGAANWELVPPPFVGTPPPGAGDYTIFGNLAAVSPYIVTVDGTDSPVGPLSGIEIDVTAIAGAPVFSISGTLATNSIIYHTDAGDPATSMTIEAGGSLDVVTMFSLLFSVDVNQTITISAAAGTAGGHLELGGPDVGGPISGTNALMTFAFDNTSPTALNTGVIQIDNADSLGIVTSQTIADVGWGDRFVITGADFTGDTVALNTTTDVLTVTNPGSTTVFTMDNMSLETGAPNSFVASGDVIQAVCYARGTMIQTPTGERPVETLRPGIQVITLVGGDEVPRAVKWVGHRRIDLTRHPRPETVAPIRVERDAFADNVPHRDLLLSPDHAVFVDGKLICVRQLVNGSTIRWERGWTAVDYYHVELDRHAILLAEGLTVESYLDTGNRGFFANSAAPLTLYPNMTEKAHRRAREIDSCAPFASDAARVQPIWQRVADRAAAIGRAAPLRATTTEARLRLQCPGLQTIEPIYRDSNRAIFVLPHAASEVRLVSRAQAPTEARPWLDDCRRLGVRVKRIVLRGADDLCEVPVDHPDLTGGWWATERDGQTMCRWTDGEAVLPLPAMSGNVMLEIHLAGSMIYVEEAAPGVGTERRAAALVHE